MDDHYHGNKNYLICIYWFFIHLENFLSIFINWHPIVCLSRNQGLKVIQTVKLVFVCSQVFCFLFCAVPKDVCRQGANIQLLSEGPFEYVSTHGNFIVFEQFFYYLFLGSQLISMFCPVPIIEMSLKNTVALIVLFCSEAFVFHLPQFCREFSNCLFSIATKNEEL